MKTYFHNGLLTKRKTNLYKMISHLNEIFLKGKIFYLESHIDFSWFRQMSLKHARQMTDCLMIPDWSPIDIFLLELFYLIHLITFYDKDQHRINKKMRIYKIEVTLCTMASNKQIKSLDLIWMLHSDLIFLTTTRSHLMQPLDGN